MNHAAGSFKCATIVMGFLLLAKCSSSHMVYYSVWAAHSRADPGEAVQKRKQ